MTRGQRTITDAVRDIMASLPETEEIASHGAPSYRVRGKVFASYMINHHGDGRVALWLAAPRGAQATWIKLRPDVYFAPPYLGPRGWLGVQLDKGLDWDTLCEHVGDAYELVAPAELVRGRNEDFRVRPPTRQFRPEEIDPFLGRRAQAVLKRLDALCRTLPEVVRGTTFGAPMWQAGRKTFVSTHYYTGRFQLSAWVGAERQEELAREPRFRISPYTGHNGWIDLDLEEDQDWDQIEQLVLGSYRHFAQKRMLQALGEKSTPRRT